MKRINLLALNLAAAAFLIWSPVPVLGSDILASEGSGVESLPTDEPVVPLSEVAAGADQAGTGSDTAGVAPRPSPAAGTTEKPSQPGKSGRKPRKKKKQVKPWAVELRTGYLYDTNPVQAEDSDTPATGLAAAALEYELTGRYDWRVAPTAVVRFGAGFRRWEYDGDHPADRDLSTFRARIEKEFSKKTTLLATASFQESQSPLTYLRYHEPSMMLTLTHKMSRTLAARFSGVYSHRYHPLSPDRDFNEIGPHLALRWNLTRKFALEAEYHSERRDARDPAFDFRQPLWRIESDWQATRRWRLSVNWEVRSRSYDAPVLVLDHFVERPIARDDRRPMLRVEAHRRLSEHLDFGIGWFMQRNHSTDPTKAYGRSVYFTNLTYKL